MTGVLIKKKRRKKGDYNTDRHGGKTAVKTQEGMAPASLGERLQDKSTLAAP